MEIKKIGLGEVGGGSMHLHTPLKTAMINDIFLIKQGCI